MEGSALETYTLYMKAATNGLSWLCLYVDSFICVYNTMLKKGGLNLEGEKSTRGRRKERQGRNAYFIK